MITPLQVKFAKHCALVEVVEHFVYCGYLVTFPDDDLVCPTQLFNNNLKIVHSYCITLFMYTSNIRHVRYVRACTVEAPRLCFSVD